MLAILMNVIVGTMFSRLTSVTHAKIEGARQWDRKRLSGIMHSLQDVPIALARPRLIESQALEDPEVKSAELVRNPFGYASLKIEYRRPVAKFRNTTNLAISDEGVLYPSHDLPDRLPLLSLPPHEPPMLASLASNWQPIAISTLAARANEKWREEQLQIDVDERGSVCLNIGTGRVVLGSANDIDRKLDVLRDRLSRNPSELQTVEILNLTVPEKPTIVPKKANKT